MAFLSELIGRPVIDVDGKIVGKLKDVIARPRAQFPHPVIEAILVQRKVGLLEIPFSNVAALTSVAIPLLRRVEDTQPFRTAGQDIFLARDVLDKQIIDTEGARVVRVNDLELVRLNGTVLVSNVDIGSMGILRRVGLAKAAQQVTSRLHLRIPQGFIAWDDMELLRYDQSMRLKVPRDKIVDLHPADIAEIVSDLDRLESGQFLDALPVEQLADTLEEVEPDYQASLVQAMPDEKVADVLGEMDPDEAADLLAELPRERSEDLLALMEAEDAQDVRKLLAYPEDSAGGIMTTEYAAVSPEMTAGQAIQFLREKGSEAETIFYVYVTSEQGHLEGVFSLRGLIFADPELKVSEFMTRRVIYVSVLDNQDQVAQVIAKYNLVAVPVVDENNVLHGIVTADDALDKIIPTAWKKRLPRFFH